MVVPDSYSSKRLNYENKIGKKKKQYPLRVWEELVGTGKNKDNSHLRQIVAKRTKKIVA